MPLSNASSEGNERRADLPEVDLFLKMLQDDCIIPLLDLIKKVQDKGIRASSQMSSEFSQQTTEIFRCDVQRLLDEMDEQLNHSFNEGRYIGPVTTAASMAVRHDLRKILSFIRDRAKIFIDMLRSGGSISESWLEESMNEHVRKCLDVQFWRDAVQQILDDTIVYQNDFDEYFHSIDASSELIRSVCEDHTIECEVCVPDHLRRQPMPYSRLLDIVLEEYIQNAVDAGATQCV